MGNAEGYDARTRAMRNRTPRSLSGSWLVAVAALALSTATTAHPRRAPRPSGPAAAAGSVRLTFSDGRTLDAAIAAGAVQRRSFYVRDAPCGSCVGEHLSLEWRAAAAGEELHVRIDAANPNSRNLHGPAQSFRSGERYPGRLEVYWTAAGGAPVEVPGIVDLDRTIAETDGALQLTFRPLPGTRPPLREFVARVLLPPAVREERR